MNRKTPIIHIVADDPVTKAVMESMQEYERQEQQRASALSVYLPVLMQGQTIPYTRYLATGFPEDNTRRIATLAMQLSKVSKERRGKTLSRILKDISDAIDEEIHHDGPNVMNMVGVFNTIKEKSRFIYSLAETIPLRLKPAREALLSAGFNEYKNLTAEKTFIQIVPEHGFRYIQEEEIQS